MTNLVDELSREVVDQLISSAQLVSVCTTQREQSSTTRAVCAAVCQTQARLSTSRSCMNASATLGVGVAMLKDTPGYRSVSNQMRRAVVGWT